MRYFWEVFRVKFYRKKALLSGKNTISLPVFALEPSFFCERIVHNYGVACGEPNSFGFDALLLFESKHEN